MSTEREATPPTQIWVTPDKHEGPFVSTIRGGHSDVKYIRADSFDTMRDALREIAEGDFECNCEHDNEYCCARVGEYCPFCIASSALAAIDGKDS